MNIPIFFKALIRHELPLIHGQNLYTFLGDSDQNEDSVLELKEQEVVKWLISDQSALQLMIFDIIDRKYKYSIFPEVQAPILNSTERKRIGDVDLLLVPENRNNLSIAIEFKKIKFETLRDGSIKINGFNRAKKKGVKQANELRKLEFHQVYLGIIILDDGRFVNKKGTIFKSVNGQDLDHIFQLTFDEKLNKNIGVFYVILNQPTGQHYTSRFNLKYCVHKYANQEKQSDERNNRIKELLNSIKTA